MNFTSLHETGTKNMSRLKESTVGNGRKGSYPEIEHGKRIDRGLGYSSRDKASERAVTENSTQNRK